MHHSGTTVVVGPGAIGCLFASFLARGKQDLFLLDHNPHRAAALDASGLSVEEPEGVTTQQVRVTANAAEIGPAHTVFICVKAHDTAEAVRHAMPLLGPDTCIVSVQNGLGNLETLATAAPGRALLCVATSHGSTASSPGHVVHAGQGRTLVAPRRPQHRALAARLAARLSQCGIRATTEDDAAQVVWSKLVINAAINPVTAIAGIRNGELPQRPELARMALAAAREASDVARANGIALLYDNPEAEVRNVCALTANNVSSMLADVRAHRRTEIDAINGAIVREATRLGIGTPVNARLCERIGKIEQDSESGGR